MLSEYEVTDEEDKEYSPSNLRGDDSSKASGRLLSNNKPIKKNLNRGDQECGRNLYQVY
jgi:hypothetical protein